MIRNYAIGLLAVLLFIAAAFGQHQFRRANSLYENLSAAEAQNDALKAQIEDAQELARKTAAARSRERAELAALYESLSVAQEGIANAPDADSSFTYSDAAYGFMRRNTPAAAKAEPADVGQE